MAWFQRDASFWKSPDTRNPKKVHRMHPTVKSNYNQAKYGHRVSLCGIALIDDFEWDDPPESMKCKKCLAAMTERKASGKT